MYGIAVILESTSLSEFLIDYGSTIVPGKEKYPAPERHEVYSISELLYKEKTLYQDLPMICLLCFSFLISVSSGVFDLVTVCFIGVTGVSMVLNFLSMKSPRN
jgi:hypothetical protein